MTPPGFLYKIIEKGIGTVKTPMVPVKTFFRGKLMKRQELTDNQKTTILELASGEPTTQEAMAEEVHCRKQKVGEWLREFKSEMTWEQANAFCGEQHRRFLRLRPDYADRMIREEREARTKMERERETILREIRTMADKLGEEFGGWANDQTGQLELRSRIPTPVCGMVNGRYTILV